MGNLPTVGEVFCLSIQEVMRIAYEWQRWKDSRRSIIAENANVVDGHQRQEGQTSGDGDVQHGDVEG